jgi:hypothetical protein
LELTNGIFSHGLPGRKIIKFIRLFVWNSNLAGIRLLSSFHGRFGCLFEGFVVRSRQHCRRLLHLSFVGLDIFRYKLLKFIIFKILGHLFALYFFCIIHPIRRQAAESSSISLSWTLDHISHFGFFDEGLTL